MCPPQVMAQILKDMGITEYEPRVINQMLEFAYSKRGRAGSARGETRVEQGSALGIRVSCRAPVRLGGRGELFPP